MQLICNIIIVSQFVNLSFSWCLHSRFNFLCKKYCLKGFVYHTRNNIALIEIECLNFIVELFRNMWPTSSIWTYHVTSMANSFVIEYEAFFLQSFFMTHTQSNPIWCTFLNLESEYSKIIDKTNSRLHQSNLILSVLFWNNSVWIHYPNIFRFQFRWKIEDFFDEKIFYIFSWFCNSLASFF